MVIFTIGHSNRQLEEFLALLEARGVGILADVRLFPHSRHNPQFNRDSLPLALAPWGIEYFHMPGLGGRRKAHKDSVNTGWQNLSFRGYADYLQTPEFEKNLAELLDLAEKRPVAVMCAESVPWRCHRWLIADALTVREVAVEHILSLDATKLHEMTKFASVDGLSLTYPPDTLQLF
jgi:uncharacterized protein (DUF488 family)